MPYKLSPSTLELMEQCPRCFWLQFRKDIKRPRGIFPSLPSGMDRVLKVHFDSFMGKGKLPPELCNDECKNLKLFDNKELLKEWRNNLKGIQWKDSNGNILKGAVDNLLQKGDKLIVLDFKTRGYPCKEDTADYYQCQLDVYNFLLRQNGYKTEDYAYLLFYVPKEVDSKGKVVFDNDLIKMEVDVNNAEKIWKKALKLLEDDMPKPSENCEYCKRDSELLEVVK